MRPFLDSTIAYQGYGNGIDIKTIEQLGLFATRGLVPDLTVLFDISPEKGLGRAGEKKTVLNQGPWNITNVSAMGIWN